MHWRSQKRDPHGARWLVQVDRDTVQQVDEGILICKSGLIGELEEVQERLDPVPFLDILQFAHQTGKCQFNA